MSKIVGQRGQMCNPVGHYGHKKTSLVFLLWEILRLVINTVVIDKSDHQSLNSHVTLGDLLNNFVSNDQGLRS